MQAVKRYLKVLVAVDFSADRRSAERLSEVAAGDIVYRNEVRVATCADEALDLIGKWMPHVALLKVRMPMLAKPVEEVIRPSGERPSEKGQKFVRVGSPDQMLTNMMHMQSRNHTLSFLIQLSRFRIPYFSWLWHDPEGAYQVAEFEERFHTDAPEGTVQIGPCTYVPTDCSPHNGIRWGSFFERLTRIGLARLDNENRSSSRHRKRALR